MAVFTWKPIRTSRIREKTLTGNTETLLYYANDITQTADAQGRLLTDDRVQSIEDDVPVTANHPDIAHMPGAILLRRRLVAGPSNGKAVVAVTWGQPPPFRGGATSSILITEGPGDPIRYYKSLLFYVNPITHKKVYQITREIGNLRAQLRIVETKPLGAASLTTYGIYAGLIASNYGQGYVKAGIPCILRTAQLSTSSSNQLFVRYEFYSTARVRGLPVDKTRGFALAHPNLDYLEEWIPQYDDAMNPQEIVAIGKLTAADQYDEGGQLP